MYRVMLVDDEFEIRNGLKLKIDWPALGFVIAGEAANGREALQLLERESFDLILTDIRMPVMSGIELLKQCAENFPRTQIIVLSGFDDFHYVKSALQCGARDYLLKPVIRGDLTQILGKLREELDAERRSSGERQAMQYRLRQNLILMREQLMLDWIGNDDEDRNPSLRQEIERLEMNPWLNDDRSLRFVSVEYRVPDGRLDGPSASGGLFRLAFQLVCRETAQDARFAPDVFPFFHRGYPRMMHFLVSCPDGSANEARAGELCKQVQSYVRRYLRVETVIGVGSAVRGLDRLREGFLSSLMAWGRSQTGIVSQIVSVDPSHDAFGESFPETEKRLALALENGDLNGFANTLQGVFRAGEHPTQGVAAFVLRVMLLLDRTAGKYRLDIPETQQWMFPETMWRLPSDAAALPYLTEMASRVIEGVKGSRTSGGIEAAEEARKYIDAFYMNDLSLTMLANRFHINPTYLSELFKKQTGSNFSDYVAQVRIGRAAELLGDPSMRLSDIAELVGFANASYLSSVFKKHYGISPNEYRHLPASPSS